MKTFEVFARRVEQGRVLIAADSEHAAKKIAAGIPWAAYELLGDEVGDYFAEQEPASQKKKTEAKEAGIEDEQKKADDEDADSN